MKVSEKTKSKNLPLCTLNIEIIEGIRDKKGNTILHLDLSKLGDTSANHYVICQGESTTHVNSIADSVVKRVQEELGERPIKVDGKRNGKWVVIDYFETVVHVFHPEAREYYRLEDLWNDAVRTSYKDL